MKNKIFYIVLSLVFAGNLFAFGFSRADTTQIALNTEAVGRFEEALKQNAIDHKAMAKKASDDIAAQTKVILAAIAAK